MANPKQIYGRDTKWRTGVILALVSELFKNGRDIHSNINSRKKNYVVAEKLITKAKPTLANRRAVASILRPTLVNEKDTVLKHLFDTIAPKYAQKTVDTRIYEIVSRQGDSALWLLSN